MTSVPPFGRPVGRPVGRPALPRSLPATEPDAAHAIADHIDTVYRSLLAVEGSLVSPACFRFLTGEPHPLGNLALFSRDASADEVAEHARPLVDASLPTAILFLDRGTPEQVEAAAGLGFVHGESMPAMSVTPDTLAGTSLPAGYTCREVTPDEAAAWSRAMAEGYGVPLPIAALLSVDRAAAHLPGPAHYYAAEHKGQMVATSLVFLHDGYAGIYGVATLPEHRGKGLGAHLTAEPLRKAWELGYTTGLLQASEMGAPVYTRIGFKTHGHMELMIRMPQ